MPKKKGQKIITEPICVKGQLFIDDRGEVGCVNDFDMSKIKRFYTVTIFALIAWPFSSVLKDSSISCFSAS